MSFFSPKKPQPAITDIILKLIQGKDDVVVGIPELVEVISLQRTGPSEAARAIRKLLKYGNVRCQLRALNLLDELIQNCDLPTHHTLVDRALIERLRLCATSNLTAPIVKAKCFRLFNSWATEYQNTEGLEHIAVLYKQLPLPEQISVSNQTRPKVLDELDKNPFEDGDNEVGQKIDLRSKSQTQNLLSPVNLARTSWSSSLFGGPLKKITSKEKDSKKQKEKPSRYSVGQKKTLVKNRIAEASVAATCLMNVLKSMSNQQDQISENKDALNQFETCKKLRKTIIHYIQNIDDEEWISALLHANDQLVNAITIFEQLTNSVDADSDSDTDANNRFMHQNRPHTHEESAYNHLALPSKEIPGQVSPSGDEDDPFADRNAVSTPILEATSFEWCMKAK